MSRSRNALTQNRRIKTPRERRRQKIVFWGVVVLLLAYAVLGGDYKLHHLIFLTAEKDRVAWRIDELKTENAMLARQQRRLEGDTLLLEQLAREKGMKKPGEIIYRLVPLISRAPDRRADDTDAGGSDPKDAGEPRGDELE